MILGTINIVHDQLYVCIAYMMAPQKLFMHACTYGICIIDLIT